MIEIINNCFGAFIIALVVYSMFSKRMWIDFAVMAIAPVYLVYLIGFKIGTGDLGYALLPLLVLILFVGTIAWRMKNAPEDPQEIRFYTRDELIIAKKIYDQNCLADPEGFQPTQGTQEDAEVSIDYLLGIIDADSEKYRKVKYGTPI